VGLGTLALLLTGLVVTADDVTDNLDFTARTLAGWQGEGFALAPAGNRTTAEEPRVSSADRGPASRTGLLHRTIVVPPGVSTLQVRAFAVRPAYCKADDRLDIALLASGKRLIPKTVREGTSWKAVDNLLPAEKGEPREYQWSVHEYVGQPLRIVLVDEDPRPKCYVVCGGFRLVVDSDARSFSAAMVHLAQEHHLPPMSQYDTPHFIGLSNAEEDFTRAQLRNCEAMYSVFFEHFRQKGFEVKEPEGKLAVAIFDSQAGFEAYLSRKVSPLIRGFYQIDTNRFVMYDYGQNDAYVSLQRRADRQGSKIDGLFDRQRYLESVHRRTQDFRNDANTSTVMHEVSHQLAWNCGLLNREAETPPWVSEGMACYCESTAFGVWQGIGEPNAERLHDLATLAKTGELLSVRELVSSNRWLTAGMDRRRLLGCYAQSWTLFRMLMEDEPAAMRNYLRSVYQERTTERSLIHFQQAFGGDLAKLDRRHIAYIRNQLAAQSK
jgi:Protein of unknown function (DUF1570)